MRVLSLFDWIAAGWLRLKGQGYRLMNILLMK